MIKELFNELNELTGNRYKLEIYRDPNMYALRDIKGDDIDYNEIRYNMSAGRMVMLLTGMIYVLKGMPNG